MLKLWSHHQYCPCGTFRHVHASPPYLDNRCQDVTWWTSIAEALTAPNFYTPSSLSFSWHFCVTCVSSCISNTKKIYTTQAAAADIYVLLCEKGKWKNDPDSRLCIALYSPDFFGRKNWSSLMGISFSVQWRGGGNKWWHCILKCFSLITKYYCGWMEAAVAAYFHWKFRCNVFCFYTSERHFLACNLPIELTQA